MSRRDEVLAQVKEIVSQASSLPVEEIDSRQDFILDMCLDSLAIIEMIVDLEHAFKLEISDELSERMNHIDDVVDYILSKVK